MRYTLFDTPFMLKYCSINAGWMLFVLCTLSSAQQSNQPLFGSVKQFFSANSLLLKTTFMNLVNKKPIELRIKADNKIEVYYFSQALLDNQPSFSCCLLPVDYYMQREENDVEIGYVLHTHIAAVITLTHKIALATTHHERSALYQELQNDIRSNKIGIIQALQYQIILNSLQLRLNIDNSKQEPDIIHKIIYEELCIKRVENFLPDKPLLNAMAKQNDVLNSIISRLLIK